MKINIIERLILGGVFLPETGGFVEMLTVQSIKDKIKFTQDEISEFDLKDSENGGVSWGKDKEVEFQFSDNEVSIMKKAFKDHDDKKTIRMDMMSLCKKISEL